jgi:hypothetical protein
MMPTEFFHVTRTANQESIRAHGLDWRRMTNWGIANSQAPEVDGVFLCRDRFEADWFVQMGGSDGDAIDVWRVTLDYEFDVEEPPADVPFAESPEGYLFHTRPIPADRIELHQSGA